MRKIWTISRNASGKNGHGTEAAKATMWAMIAFGLVVILSIIGTYFYYWINYYNYYHPETHKVVVVNAPDDFKKFVFRSPAAADYYYYFCDYPYEYDIAKFNSLMDEKEADLTVVFPSEYDPDDKPIDVLTFYPIDSLEYLNIRDEFVDNVLDAYDVHIMKEADVPVSGFKNVDVNITSYSSTRASYGQRMLQSNATSTIPLIFFVGIMYLAMSAGTTAIAAPKEQGTFAAVLMTPVPRHKIILGYTLHVWLRTMIPVIAMMIPILLVPTYRAGAIPVLLLMTTLALFVSALTILISTLNDTVVSAQTTFLPIFLVFIVLCVTCMQDTENYAAYYYVMPLYGQFLGCGVSLMGKASTVLTILCCIVTLALSVLLTLISTKLLSFERFTVSSVSASDKKLKAYDKAASKSSAPRKVRGTVFEYNKPSRLSHIRFITMQILRPLGLLAIFQTLSLIPPLLLTDGKGLTDIILSLKSVTNVSEVLDSSAAIMSVLMNTPSFLISMGLGYYLIIAAYVIHTRLIEKEPLSTIGLPKKRIVSHYLSGLLLGLLLMGSVYGILLLSGQITSKAMLLTGKDLTLFFAFIFMWLPQGATEEIMFRGHMMSRTAVRYGKTAAIILSSVMFCIFHGLNPGFTVLALINLILISVLYALIAIKLDSIWILMSAHSMWNFAQGNLFGLEVSGNANNASLLVSSSTESSSSLWTGGGFGPEGGLAVTIVVVIAIATIVLAGRRQKNISTSK